MHNNRRNSIKHDNLNRPIDHDEMDSCLWKDKCDYIELDHCTNLNQNNYNLITMQLNIRSILAHQQELSQLLRNLERKGSHVDIILLSETFLTKKTEKMVNIPGYKLIGKHCPTRKGGGICILLNENIPYKRRHDLDIFEEGILESVFLGIRVKNGRKIIVGSMYKPPNAESKQLIDGFETLVTKLRSNQKKDTPELIIGIDHNLDLLKGQIHLLTRHFIDRIDKLNLLPTITRPSRITSHSATLIDNIYISQGLHQDFESLLLLMDISNHLPLITMMRQTRLADKSPLKYESRCLTEDKLNQVRNSLFQKDWVGLLNGTTNANLDRFSQIISDELEKVAPKCIINISAKRKYIEPWMTKGLEKASNKKLKLYKVILKPDHTEEDIMKYKVHRNIYNALKRSAKITYYQEKCKSYKQNTKKLWGLINETIKKTKHRGSIIPFITINGIKLHKAKEIANSFGEFYSTLGADFAGKILSSTTPIDNYISRIPNQLSSLAFNGTTVPEIEHIINQLPNKSSHGHDDISNTMLKSLLSWKEYFPHQ